MWHQVNSPWAEGQKFTEQSHANLREELTRHPCLQKVEKKIRRKMKRNKKTKPGENNWPLIVEYMEPNRCGGGNYIIDKLFDFYTIRQITA